MPYQTTPQTAAAAQKNIAAAPDARHRAGQRISPRLSELCVDKKVSYAKIPGFPKPGVSGHAANCISATWAKRR